MSQSCSNDPCNKTICSDEGFCIDGTCVCDNGYEGDYCELEIRSRFLGTYTGKIEYTNGDIFTDFNSKVTISSIDQDIELFQISHFQDLSTNGFPFLAIVDTTSVNNNTFEIVGNHTFDRYADGDQVRLRYSGASPGMKSQVDGTIVVKYTVEELDLLTNEPVTSITNTLTLTPI